MKREVEMTSLCYLCEDAKYPLTMHRGERILLLALKSAEC